MRAELASITHQLDAATARARAIAERAGDQQWTARPAPDRWSVGECIDHLNRSSEAYLPLFDQALRKAPAGVGGRLRRDVPGWLLSKMLEPPVRIRMKTRSRFVPPLDVGSRPEVMHRYEALQEEIKQIIVRCEGVDVARIKIYSPFAKRLRYSVYSAFYVIPVHQRRHLWQAEAVLDDLT